MTQADEQDVAPDANEVQIRGRVAAVPEVRVMPSGDELVSFRVIVRRPASARRHSKITVDTIDCAAWTASTRRAAGKLQRHDVVEVSGSLRRRFQRGGGGAVSRVDVEVARCRRVSAAPVPRRPRVTPSDA